VVSTRSFFYSVKNAENLLLFGHMYFTFGRTVALWLIQPFTEMSTRVISWGAKGPVRKAGNPATFTCQLS
jgi:hypothetical protein